MDKNENSFLFSLWNCFRRHEDRDPVEAQPEKSQSLPTHKLRQLERCLTKDCEIEINRKKLERQWQKISS